MAKVETTVVIDAPRQAAWDALADFAGIWKFHPYVETSPALNEVQGEGAERRCNFYDGNYVLERIVGWQPGRSIDVAIVEGSMPLRDARATVSVRADGVSRTAVTFEMVYTPKYGPVGWVMNQLVMRRQFKKILTEVVRGLETHLQSGHVVVRGGALGDPVPA